MRGVHSGKDHLHPTTRIFINDQSGQMVDYTKPSNRLRHRSCVEETWQLPDHLGTGYFRKTQMGSGLWIALCEGRLKTLLLKKIYDETPGVVLIFCLKGHFKNRNDCYKNSFEISAGTGWLCFSPDPVVIRQADPGDTLQKVTIKIPLSQIGLLLENRQLERAAQNEEPFLDNRPLSSGMQTALFQMFNCSFPGSARRLYLEGKALELIANWLCCGAGVESLSHPLKPDESERIWHARDLLLQDLCNPPSLMALSKAVGITHTRLNYGFKTIFGHTVFEWFRIQRLEKARMLVMEGQKNMTEIAYEIGFASSSHFTCAFRKFFGTTPSRYR